jgi:hypothetical protein
MAEPKRNIISLNTYNELYVIDCDVVMYLQADDHYTIVNYLSGAHFMVPFGLSVLEDSIQECCSNDKFLVRLGRKYIINIRAIFHINTVKQVVLLSDAHGNNHSLHLPKPILRSLIDLLSNGVISRK